MEDNGQLVHRLPLVHLLTTGGTIACVLRDGALQPLLGGDEMLASLPGVSEIARIDVEPFSSVTGWNMEPAMMLRLALRIEEVLQNEDVSGVVVTHGTDTVEETMIACSLVVSSPKPVVFAAAMRSPGVPGSDGPANLLGAIRTAASKAAYGSVVLCVNDELHAARYVTKTDCSNVHAFESPGHGPVGRVAFDGLRFVRLSCFHC
jgi:L-asparaginase